jgi:ketosteroid isomerase-like protein
MRADPATEAAIVELIGETYRRLSTPGSDAGALLSHQDMAVAGSGIGELAYGPDDVSGMAEFVASRALGWHPDEITVWQEGDVAWAQILGSVHVTRPTGDEDVPYTTTGVFARDADGAWQWRYWGGAEPQAEPRV